MAAGAPAVLLGRAGAVVLADAAPGLPRPPRRAGRAPGGVGGISHEQLGSGSGQAAPERDRPGPDAVRQAAVPGRPGRCPLYHLILDPTVLGIDDRAGVGDGRRRLLRRQPRESETSGGAIHGAALARCRRDTAARLGLERSRALAALPLVLDVPADRPAGDHRRRRRPLGGDALGVRPAPDVGAGCFSPSRSSAPSSTTAFGMATRPAPSWPGWPAWCGRAFLVSTWARP